jgi:hypothetical protein
MANANIARGLVPVCHKNGQPFNGACRKYYVPASDGTALFVGDPVKFVTDASDANGVPTITIGTAGGGAFSLGVVLGVVTGGDPAVVRTFDKTVYRVASTEAYLLIADDPDLLFEIQEDSVGGVMTVGAAGRNADLVAGSGSTVTGRSGWMLDSSTLNTTNTLQMRIVGPVDRPDNEPTLDYAKWLVSFNLHAQRNLTGV